jgi:hypothetical protein
MYDCTYTRHSRIDTLLADTIDNEGLVNEEEVTFENL